MNGPGPYGARCQSRAHREPSLIKHAFLIIRENRTYDQILGDVAAGNGDAELAVFGGQDTPNAHARSSAFRFLTISTTPGARLHTQRPGWQCR